VMKSGTQNYQLYINVFI